MKTIEECIDVGNKMVAVACEKTRLAKEGRVTNAEAAHAIAEAAARLRKCTGIIERARARGVATS